MSGIAGYMEENLVRYMHHFSLHCNKCVHQKIIIYCLQRYLQHLHCSVLVRECVYVQRYYRALTRWRISAFRNTEKVRVNTSAIVTYDGVL